MNKFFYVVLFATSLLSMFLVGKSALEIEKFFSFDGKTKGFINSWEIEKKDSSSFALVASYFFFVKNSKITGRTEFMKPYFLNKESAEKAVNKLSSQQDFEVFYNTGNLQKNSLQKAFPFQDCIRAFLSFGILLYFFFLKKWVIRPRHFP